MITLDSAAQPKFTTIEDLEFSIDQIRGCKGPYFCVSVSDKAGNLLIGCIGSSGTFDGAKTEAVNNMTIAIQKILLVKMNEVKFREPQNDL